MKGGGEGKEKALAWRQSDQELSFQMMPAAAPPPPSSSHFFFASFLWHLSTPHNKRWYVVHYL